MSVSFFIAGWLIVSFAGPAFAYLDPVTGSFLIQGIIAGAVAVLAAIRSVRVRVLTLFGFRKPESPATKASHQDNVIAKSSVRDAS